MRIPPLPPISPALLRVYSDDYASGSEIVSETEDDGGVVQEDAEKAAADARAAEEAAAAAKAASEAEAARIAEEMAAAAAAAAEKAEADAKRDTEAAAAAAAAATAAATAEKAEADAKAKRDADAIAAAAAAAALAESGKAAAADEDGGAVAGPTIVSAAADARWVKAAAATLIAAHYRGHIVRRKQREADAEARKTKIGRYAFAGFKGYETGVEPFLGRYDIQPGQPMHVSSSCCVVYGTDRENPDRKTGLPQMVALKFMQSQQAFERELSARVDIDGLSSVVKIMQGYRSDAIREPGDLAVYPLTEASPQFPRKDLESYPQIALPIDEAERGGRTKADKSGPDLDFLLVMEAGLGDLGDLISHGYVAGKNVAKIRSVASGIAVCLQGMHAKKMLHGDVSKRNFAMLAGGRCTAIDLAAAVKIDGESLAGQTTNTASGSLPPEQAAIVYHRRRLELLADNTRGMKAWRTSVVDRRAEIQRLNSERRLAFANGNEPAVLALTQAIIGVHADEEDRGEPPPIIASPAYDVWGFGVLLYELCTGGPLFNVDARGDVIELAELARIADWTDAHKKAALDRVDPRWPKSMLSQLLHRDPEQRPTAWHDIINGVDPDAHCEAPEDPTSGRRRRTSVDLELEINALKAGAIELTPLTVFRNPARPGGYDIVDAEDPDRETLAQLERTLAAVKVQELRADAERLAQIRIAALGVRAADLEKDGAAARELMEDKVAAIEVKIEAVKADPTSLVQSKTEALQAKSDELAEATQSSAKERLDQIAAKVDRYVFDPSEGIAQMLADLQESIDALGTVTNESSDELQEQWTTFQDRKRELEASGDPGFDGLDHQTDMVSAMIADLKTQAEDIRANAARTIEDRQEVFDADIAQLMASDPADLVGNEVAKLQLELEDIQADSSGHDVINELDAEADELKIIAAEFDTCTVDELEVQIAKLKAAISEDNDADPGACSEPELAATDPKMLLEGQIHGDSGPRPDTALIRRASELLAEAENMGIQTAQGFSADVGPDANQLFDELSAVQTEFAALQAKYDALVSEAEGGAEGAGDEQPLDRPSSSQSARRLSNTERRASVDRVRGMSRAAVQNELKHNGLKATGTTIALHDRLIKLQLEDPVPDPEPAPKPASEPEPVLASENQLGKSSSQVANDFLSIFPPGLESGTARVTTEAAELAAGSLDVTAPDIAGPRGVADRVADLVQVAADTGQTPPAEVLQSADLSTQEDAPKSPKGQKSSACVVM